MKILLNPGPDSSDPTLETQTRLVCLRILFIPTIKIEHTIYVCIKRLYNYKNKIISDLSLYNVTELSYIVDIIKYLYILYF